MFSFPRDCCRAYGNRAPRPLPAFPVGTTHRSNAHDTSTCTGVFFGTCYIGPHGRRRRNMGPGGCKLPSDPVQRGGHLPWVEPHAETKRNCLTFIDATVISPGARSCVGTLIGWHGSLGVGERPPPNSRHPRPVQHARQATGKGFVSEPSTERFKTEKTGLLPARP